MRVLFNKTVDCIDKDTSLSPYTTSAFRPRVSIVRDMQDGTFVRLTRGSFCREVLAEDMHCLLSQETFSVLDYHLFYRVVSSGDDITRHRLTIINGYYMLKIIEDELGWKNSTLINLNGERNSANFILKLNPRWKRSVHMLYLVTLFIRLFGSITENPRRFKTLRGIYRYIRRKLITYHLTRSRSKNKYCKSNIILNNMRANDVIFIDAEFFVQFYPEINKMLRNYKLMHEGNLTTNQWHPLVNDLNGAHRVALFVRGGLRLKDMIDKSLVSDADVNKVISVYKSYLRET